MSIETTEHGSIVVTGRASIELFRLLVLRSKLQLEMHGLRVSRGRTAYSVLKSELRLRGDRTKVLAQVDVLLSQYRANVGAQEVQ